MKKRSSHVISPLHRLSSESGSIMITTMIIGIIISIMLFSSMAYMKSRGDVVFKASNKLDNRIVLDGVYAYTVNAIKQSWCFTGDWTQNTGSCNLNNARNTVRLLLNDETLTYIDATDVPRPANILDTRLSEISATINLDSLTQSNPIYNITLPVAKAYSTLTVTIKREDSAIASTKGREVPLSIAIVLIPDVESEAYPRLELTSRVLVYPRELTYFGLILPKNLYLGYADPALDTGNSAFANLPAPATAGLRFESPVFVNSNIYMPPTGSSKMSNVSFVDKIVIGGGLIYQGTDLFTPIDAGGAQSDLNSNNPVFTGLLGGYELDRQKDEGLDYLYNLNVPTTPPNLARADLCRARIAASYDLMVTASSQLYTKFVSASGNTIKTAVSLGLIDAFVEQSASNLYSVKTTVPTVTTAGLVNNSWNGGAVMKARFVYEGMADPSAAGSRGVFTNEFFIPRNGTINIYPNGTGGGQPEIVVTASPYMMGSDQQHNRVDLTITFNNAGALDIAPYKPAGSTVAVPGSIKLFLEAMDYGYTSAENKRATAYANPAIGVNKTNGFMFTKSGSTVTIVGSGTAYHLTPTLLANTAIESISATEAPDDTLNLTELDKECMKVPDSNSAFYASFPAADWATSFVKQSRIAWKFTPDGDFNFADPADGRIGGYLPGTQIFNAGTNSLFKIKSLMKNCVIDASATLVTGFYTCENLEIQARSTPLRIIGTFITKRIVIAPSAYTAGIRWSTIYHPQAVYELRAAGILGKRADGSIIDCNSNSMPPLWSANVGLPTAVDHYLCNPVSLRKADPFKWTTVDPDCGVVEGKTERSCKKAMTRFLVKEISRMKGL
jgi:hypothetical protein